MNILPEPLRPLGAYAQFIIYKLVPHKTKPGKMDKLPVDHRTLNVYTSDANWQTDPAATTTFENASKLAALCGTDHGVGFFFKPNDPFFFLDIDNCLQGANWSPVAMDLMTRLPGAAVEVSQSGTGLHIFGSMSRQIEHSCKNSTYDTELYTSGRFVALTGDRAVGSASTDCTAGLASVVSLYHPPRVGSDAPQEWTTEPITGYTGPEDDDELIERASKSQSAASAFGSSASFADLWAADEDALGKAYPDGGGRAYDASLADAALVQHLAFWTGNNCERIQRIMKRSELVRDKWEREDYLCRTILRAVSLQKTVYSIKPAEPMPETEGLKLKGTDGQIKYALGLITSKILECNGDRGHIELITSQKSAKWWIDNRDKTLEEILAALTPIESARKPFESEPDGPEFSVGFQYLGAQQQADYFKGCVYIQENHRVFVPSGVMLKAEQFNATYGGYNFQFDDGGKQTKKAFEAFTESQIVRYPKAQTMCFKPDLPPGALIKQDGQVKVNIYVPVTTCRINGDPSPFLNHLKRVLPDETDQTILLSYMAACVQYKGVKFQWAPLLQGVEGNGKTFFTRCVAAAIGEKYVHFPPAAELGEKFNAWLFDKLFIGVEDIFVPDQKREVFEILKTMITNNRLAKRAMQTDQTMHDVCCNFIFNSNHKDSIRKTKNDRRFSVFYSAQQHADDLIRDGMTGDYFPNLYDWLRAEGYAIVTDFLYKFQIPEQYNPATVCHRAPRTSTTDEAVEASLGGIEQEILEAIDEGRPGFAGGWISSMALDLLLKSKRKDGSIPINKRKDMLYSLGYDYHPGLSDGRVNNPVLPDNGKPRLFVKMGHPDAVLTTGKDISAAYTAAQLPAVSKAQEVFGNG